MNERRTRRRVENLVSAGGVVYREVDGRIEAVLFGMVINSHAASSGANGQQVVDAKKDEDFRWSLAKGTPDPGETMEETALREVREETGLEVEIDSPLGSIEYWFVGRDTGVRYHKTVHFYLMVPVGGDFALHDPEFDVVRWFPSDEALGILTHVNEVDVLRRAIDSISKR